MHRRPFLRWGAVAIITWALSGCSASELPGGSPGSSHPAEGSGQATAAASPTPPAATLPGTPGVPPAPAARIDPVPTAGTVTLAPGPFVDRLAVTGLALTDAVPAEVTGTVAITSDVSDVIVLELHAAFYGAQGQLVGVGTTSYRDGDGGGGGVGTPAEQHGVRFTVRAPNGANGVATAVLTVPVLVNE